MRDIPLYQQSAAYAREHDELEQYRASLQANIACKNAIEKAAAENYKGYSLNTEAVLDAVVSGFGLDRVMYVLAATIRCKEWDDRFSRDNKAWAKTVNFPQDKNAFGENRIFGFVVNSHSCLTDMIVSDARRYLPPTCHCVIPSSGELVIVKRGESGYFPTGAPTISEEDSQEVADETNAERGISKAQAAAMLNGSMHGWNTPDADPRSYDAQGRLIYPKQRKGQEWER